VLGGGSGRARAVAFAGVGFVRRLPRRHFRLIDRARGALRAGGRPLGRRSFSAEGGKLGRHQTSQMRPRRVERCVPHHQKSKLYLVSIDNYRYS
jgi:hypothetical protein